MTNPFHTPFAAVFANEVRLNTKRVAPYALMVFFASNALLWWAKGPAVALGWATNSDFYILRNCGAFSFLLGLPIFTGIMMGDVVIRDFGLGVDPIIFSKPVGRGSYVFGKFFGNFFVLVCCQLAFPITYFLLQWVPFSGMVVLPVRIVPYFKHFFFIVAISHLCLAAIYFVAGTLTRNPKVVYGLVACFYPAYIALQLFLIKNLPTIFGVIVDPLGFSSGVARVDPWSQSADFLNQLVMNYRLTDYVNRSSMVLITAVCLFIVYKRFSIESQTGSSDDGFTKLTLSETTENVAYSAPSYGLLDSPFEPRSLRELIPIPKVTAAQGPTATLSKLIGAIGVEFRLLRSERGLIVLAPLAIILSFLSVPFSRIATEVSYSVISATNTANMLLLFLSCLIIFYLGETMHRDREVKVEPVLWSTPAPNSVLLLSKFFAMTFVAVAVVVLGGVTTIAAQLFRGHTPIDFAAYLKINSLIVVPGIVFLTSAVVVLNVLLRNKYLTYVVATATGASFIYLYTNGYNHWLYNPLLYRLWKYSDLTTGTVLVSRLYCLALATGSLLLAHVFFERKSK